MTVRLRDIEVAYRAEGAGPAVVLIHGLAQDRSMWARQQEDLRGVRTYAYDLRGHGDTSVGEPDGTLAQLGGDLIAFLEHIGCPARCAGFSLGGTVALWAAAERPDLVTEVAAVATSSVVGRAAAAFFAERIDLVAAGDGAAIRAALLADTRSQLTSPGIDAEALADGRMRAIGDGRGYVNAARAMLGVHAEPLNERLERIAQPVTVINGENDVFCPRRAAEIMLDHLADGRFREIAGVGHLIAEEDPGAVTAALASWLGAEAAA